MREDLGDDDDDGGDEVEGVLGEGEGVDDDEGEYEGDEVDDDDDSIRNDGASCEEDEEREETIRFSNGIREAEDLDLRHRFNEDLVFLGDEENGVEARTGFGSGDGVLGASETSSFGGADVLSTRELDAGCSVGESLVCSEEDSKGIEDTEYGVEVPLGRTSGFSDGDSVTFSGLRLKK